VFLVASGVAKLVFSGPNGREVLVALRYPGQFVDYCSHDLGGPYPLSAIALARSEVYGIDIAAIRGAQRQNPGLRNSEAELLRRDLYDLVARLVRSELLPPADRIEELVRGLAGALGGKLPDGSVRVVLPFDNSEMASLCGVSESHYKAIRRELEDAGRIRREGHNVWAIPSVR
jgi:CRP-like cAMP-binding protein